MSNIYIQEPPTKGKVILNTTVGEIEIELWSKECPKASRNFIQLCLEGYYDGTIFHRIVKDFIAQGGDPTGTGQGGESIYGEPFKDEFHSRLRYNRRGLVGMASSEPNDNGSQFFFTLGATAELEKTNTLFGKVVGKTVYNMIKLNDCECVGESPLRPEKIISTEVVYNPFEDIKPRQLKAEPVKKEINESKDKKKVVKNFGLLSFGDEAEEEEEELESVSKTLKSKPKSAHDIGDPSLLSKKVVEEDKSGRRSDSSDKSGSESEEERGAVEKKPEAVKIDEIKSKLERKAAEMASKSSSSQKADKKPISEEDQKRKETQEEIRRIQRELAEGRKQKRDEDDKIEEKKKEKKQEEEVVKEYKQDVEKYEHLRNKKLKKDKEEKTLELLNAFRNKLFKAKETELSHDNQEAKTSSTEDTETKKDTNEAASGAVASASFESLLTHKLDIDDEIRMKVIDANVADNERYDIYDPRNPLNKRKRDESRDMSREKKNKPSLGGMRRDAL